MSKLQKWCPSYTQICSLPEPGVFLYTVQLSQPLDAHFSSWHQTSLGEYPALTLRTMCRLIGVRHASTVAYHSRCIG